MDAARRVVPRRQTALPQTLSFHIQQSDAPPSRTTCSGVTYGTLAKRECAGILQASHVTGYPPGARVPSATHLNVLLPVFPALCSRRAP